MTSQSKIGGLTELLAETGRRHHEAFIGTDGADPEWPLWYAGYLEEPISRFLGMRPTRSKLVQCLLNAEEEHAATGSGRDWAEFYARYLLGLDEDEVSSPPEPASRGESPTQIP